MWYYVDDNGSLFTGGTTPDGFLVDENGVWVQ
jgi:D-alanyl-D-alanine carboxypeptidase